MNRREFVHHLSRLPPGIAAGLALAGTGCAGTPHLRGRTLPDGVAIRRAEIPETGAFVELPGGTAAWLRPDDEEGYLALSTRCTHRGCRVEPIGAWFECPCHGSLFDEEGVPVEGPAELPLEAVPLRIVGEEVLLLPVRTPTRGAR